MPADIDTIQTLLEYVDWSNDQLLTAADALSDEQLDRDMQIGVGGMRRTMLHIHNGEHVWLRRWRAGADAETKWPSESEKIGIIELGERFAANRRERDAFSERRTFDEFENQRGRATRFFDAVHRRDVRMAQ